MFRKSVGIIAILLFVIAVVSPTVSKAIPAFARKYGFSCSTCHVAAPKLKDYGDEFAGNAFQLPDEDEPVRAFRDVGDDHLLLQRDFPLAMRFDLFARYQSEEDVNYDFQTPWGVKILSGGNIAKDIGYYIYFYMSEHGEIAGIEDAYIHFNNIGGTELDLMFGQFQICDPLFKRELRLTYEDYQVYKTKVGDISSANLTYDRGIIATYSLPTGTDLTLEVVNGRGLDEAGDNGMFDGDNFKNVFGKVSQSFSIVSLGMFGYSGKEKHTNGQENAFVYFGPNINVGTERIELNGQYVRRNDDNPEFKTGGINDFTTEGYIGEIVINPFPDKSRLFGVLLYNKVTSDNAVFVQDYETMTGNISYLYRTNVRMLAELTYDIEMEESRLTIGTMVGF
ncbi:MAG: hypothetical protein JXB48_24440 [Candidatus Latescibacteria bacterium]|nr:hypothetical protein [Candidatus Latescibacterota bacterium]